MIGSLYFFPSPPLARLAYLRAQIDNSYSALMPNLKTVRIFPLPGASYSARVLFSTVFPHAENIATISYRLLISP